MYIHLSVKIRRKTEYVLEVSSKTVKYQNIETIYIIKKVKKQFKIIHF